jgi:hypothetical protein
MLLPLLHIKLVEKSAFFIGLILSGKYRYLPVFLLEFSVLPVLPFLKKSVFLQSLPMHTEIVYKLTIFCCCCFAYKTKTTTWKKPKQKHWFVICCCALRTKINKKKDRLFFRMLGL